MTAFQIPTIWPRAKEYAARGMLEKPCNAEGLLRPLR